MLGNGTKEMNEFNELHKKDYRKKSPRFVKLLVRFFLFFIGLVVLGAIYESISEASDARAFLPPGRMVGIGGYRLHLNCRGTGSPTVVIESGWGSSSSAWGWVQPEVSKTTRVCTYDRAGMGWSEMSPEPRTATVFAKELHTLLITANEAGPYVLVGHSLGGYTVRVYANDYPSEVSGVVFVDPQNISVSDAPTPTVTPKPGRFSIPQLIARIGVVRLFAGPLGAIENLPDKDKQAYTANSVSPRSVQTVWDEANGMSEGVYQARSVTTLGNLPLIVLSRGKGMDHESAASQSRYLQLSTNSLHLVADKSDHGIMIEQPDAVVEAIVKMLEIVRGSSK
jgi:pimeloyl-ACP methyl ester carboxylesterase